MKPFILSVIAAAFAVCLFETAGASPGAETGYQRAAEYFREDAKLFPRSPRHRAKKKRAPSSLARKTKPGKHASAKTTKRPKPHALALRAPVPAAAPARKKNRPKKPARSVLSESAAFARPKKTAVAIPVEEDRPSLRPHRRPAGEAEMKITLKKGKRTVSK